MSRAILPVPASAKKIRKGVRVKTAARLDATGGVPLFTPSFEGIVSRRAGRRVFVTVERLGNIERDIDDVTVLA